MRGRGFGTGGLAVALAFAGCDGGPYVPSPTDTDPTVTGDDDDTAPPVHDDDGSVIVTAENPSAVDPVGGTLLTGVFVETNRGWINLAECAGGKFCADQYPLAAGGSVLVRPYDPTLQDDLTFRDVGNKIQLGSWKADLLEEGDFRYYFAADSSLDLGDAQLGLRLFAGAWGPYEGEADILPPNPIEVTEPATDLPLEFLSADPIHLEWTPDPEHRGEIYLLVTTSVEQRLWWLEDTGTFTLDLAPLDLPDGSTVDLDLGRWTHDGVDIGGNVVDLQVKSNQHLTGTWQNIDARDPLTNLYDTCSQAERGVPVLPGYYEGDFTAFVNDLAPRRGVCTPFDNPGQDALLPIDVPSEHQLDLSYKLATGDASLYLMTDCNDTAECFVGSDAGFAGEPEVLTWVNAGPDARVYLVLDSFRAFASPFTLDVTLTSLAGAIFEPTCVDAIARGPAESGTYQGYVGANPNRLVPECWPQSDGGEGLTQVFLLPDQTLDAEVTTEGAPNAALYLLYNCSIADSCLDVAPSKHLVYQNQSGASEFLYLVLDGPPGLDGYVLDLSIQ